MRTGIIKIIQHSDFLMSFLIQRNKIVAMQNVKQLCPDGKQYAVSAIAPAFIYQLKYSELPCRTL